MGGEGVGDSHKSSIGFNAGINPSQERINTWNRRGFLRGALGTRVPRNQVSCRNALVMTCLERGESFVAANILLPSELR